MANEANILPGIGSIDAWSNTPGGDRIPTTLHALPAIYFDATRYANALLAHAAEAGVAYSNLTQLMALVKLHPGNAAIVADLARAVSRIEQHGDKDVILRAAIADITDTIDQITPADPVGYHPRLGLAYLFAPIRKRLNALGVLVFGGL